MVSLLTLTGGASLAGLWVYRRVADHTPRPRWWQTLQGALQGTRQAFTPRSRHNVAAPPDDTRPMTTAQGGNTTPADVAYGLRTATLALGVTTVGLVAPPLRVAGLPLLVYMGIPAAQATYEQFWVDGRPSRALAETVVLSVCLVGGYYWIGALGFWLYYGSRTLLAPKQSGARRQGATGETPTTVHLWKEGVTCVVPTATLQPGDQLLLQSGDMTPVASVIVEGVAWVQSTALSATASPLRKGVGSPLLAADLVVVGRVCVRVR